MKLLFFFDNHLDIQGPLTRTDNYEETSFNKLEEIKKIAKKKGCSYILCSGDFFNRKGPKVPHRLIARAADFFKSMETPFLTISGNHDQVGGNPSTIMEQPLGVLARAANFKILQKEDVTQLDEKVFLTVAPYHANIDITPEDYLPERPDNAKVHIHLTHGSLMPNKPIWSPFTLYKDLKDCKADFIFNGHLHDGYSTETVGNVTIINPGSLTRGALTEANIDRQVAVVILDTDTGKVETIPLKSALPANKVFDLERYEQNARAENEISLLSALIKHESGSIELNGPESVYALVKELQTIDTPTRETCLRLLDLAGENI